MTTTTQTQLATAGTLGTIEDLLGAADVAASAQLHDDALRYRVEAAGLLSDLAHGLLAKAERIKSDAHVKHGIACQRR